MPIVEWKLITSSADRLFQCLFCFLFATDKNPFPHDHHGSFQKCVLLQDQPAVILFFQLFVLQTEFPVLNGPPAEEGFVASGHFFHFIELGRGDFFKFDILHAEPLFINTGIRDHALAGGAVAEMIDLFHTD